MRTYALVLIIVFGVMPAYGDNPTGFYGEGFAKTPLEERQDSAFPTVGPDARGEVQSETPTGSASSAEVGTDLFDTESAPEIVSGFSKNYKVLGIGAILSVVDYYHIQETVSELTAVAKQHDFDIGRIYGIGNPVAYAMLPNVKHLLARGANIKIYDTPPERYNVSRSPTWIIYTPEGEILLEGTGALATNFNPKGEFVDKYPDPEEGPGPEADSSGN